MRSRFLNAELFKDPAWDMLLQLYADSISGQRSSVTSLCIASGSPSTTALRWLNTLISEGLVIRRPDPLDARRVFVGLSQEGAAAMERYFRSLP